MSSEEEVPSSNTARTEEDSSGARPTLRTDVYAIRTRRVLDPPATDVQAALTVIGQRILEDEEGAGRHLALALALTVLCRADLRGADLGWADLQGTDLMEADLGGAKLGEATYNLETTWPTDDFDPETAGAFKRY